MNIKNTENVKLGYGFAKLMQRCKVPDRQKIARNNTILERERIQCIVAGRLP